MVGDGHRCLGGSVQVVQTRRTQLRELGCRLGRQRLADDEHVSQGVAAPVGGVGHEDGEHRRHEIGDRHMVLGDLVRHVDRVAVPVGRRDHKGRADTQRHEESPQRHVERRCGLLQVHILGCHAVLVVHPLDLVVDGGMAHSHALGPTGRTRGEDDVRGGIGQDRTMPLRVGDRTCVTVRVVEGVDLERSGAFRQVHVVARRGQHCNRFRRLEDVAGPVGRMVGIDRHPRTAGFADGVHADDQVERAPNTQPDKRFGPDAKFDQGACESVDTGSEFAVGQRLAFEDQRCGLWRFGRLFTELGEQIALPDGMVGAVPLDDRTFEFRASRKGDIPHAPFRIRSDEPVEELDETSVVGAGLLRVVQIGIGLEVDVRVSAAAAVDVDTEILDQAGRQNVDAADHVAEPDLVVEQHDVDPRPEERGLPHRTRASVTDDVLVPVALMAQRTRDGRRRGGDEVVDGRVVGDAQAQRYDVGNHAARTTQDRVGARSYGQAQHHVGLSGHLREICGEGSDHRGGKARAFSSREFVDPPFGVRGQCGGVDTADRGGRGGAPGEAGGFLDAVDLPGPVLAVVEVPLGAAVLHFDVVDLV